MGLHISFKHPFGSHSLLHDAGGVAKSIAPYVGMIPGVGTVAATALGGLGSLAHGDKFGDILKSAAGGAAGGLTKGLGGKLFGGGESGGLSGLAGTIGKAISGPNMLGNQSGQLDLGKLLGAASGVAGIVGQGQQRKSAQNYANARTSQLNDLMSKVLSGGQNYGLPSPNLNQQSSATPGY